MGPAGVDQQHIRQAGEDVAHTHTATSVGRHAALAALAAALAFAALAAALAIAAALAAAAALCTDRSSRKCGQSFASEDL